MVYVAVSKELKSCRSTLAWALKISGGKKFRLVLVHQPAETISVLGGRFPMSSLSKPEVMAHRQLERQEMSEILDEYVRICTKAGFQAEKLYFEMATVESGLVELISQYKIERLVMGAAADNRYSRRMKEPKSKKANYVRQHAPDFCHIWFVCNARLIYTREGTKQPCLNDEINSELLYSKARLTSSSGWSTSRSRDSSEDFDDCDKSSTFSLPHLSIFSKSPEAAMDSTSVPISRNDERELSFRSLSLPPRREEKKHQSPSPPLLQERSMNDSLYDQLNQAISEAETAKREAFEESMRRSKAEKEAVEALRKANAMENSYYEELKRREDLEDELAKAKDELESTKKQRDTALEELQNALDQKSLLKSRSDKSDIMGRELEDKLRLALELLQNFREQ